MRRLCACALLSLLPAAVACSPAGDAPQDGQRSAARTSARDSVPHVAASSPVEAGAYLVEVAGCNDCHTAGYLQSGGQTPESEWLKGSRVGFRGPWGTTYPSNLRLTVRRVSEDRWVEMMKTRDKMPPMPWFNVHAMSERDLRAVYRYVGTLGEPGDSVPDPLPPGEQPETPYYDFVPRKPGGG